MSTLASTNRTESKVEPLSAGFVAKTEPEAPSLADKLYKEMQVEIAKEEAKKNYYKKPYFLPILKSKFLTIELMKMIYKDRHEVVLFLRTLCKGSSYFLE